MAHRNINDLFSSIYWIINRALWALGVILPIFMFSHLPSIWAAQEKAATELDLRIGTENRRLCQKWGTLAGTTERLDCIRDLIALRAETERRIRDETATTF